MLRAKKLIILILIVSIIGSFFVANIKETQGMAVLYLAKEFVIYPIVRKIANSLENKLVNKVSNLAAGISTGTPNFITNWKNNLLDSQARGNDVFRAVLADTKLCPYFKDSMNTTFGAEKSIGAIAGASIRDSTGKIVYTNKTNTPGLPSYQQIANCTLPENLKVDEFKNDFAKGGGWASWNALIQPQNNFYGAYALALGEQAKQINTEVQSARDSSIAGQGFLGQKLGVADSGVGPSGCVGHSLSAEQGTVLIQKRVEQIKKESGKPETQSVPIQPTLQPPSSLNKTGPVLAADTTVEVTGTPGKGPETQSVPINATLTPPIPSSTSANRCAFMGKEVTPAQILGKSAANALDKKLGRIGGASQITDIILSLVGAVVQGLTDRMSNFIAQNTYERPPNFGNSFEEGIYEPGGGAPQPMPSQDVTPQYSAGNICMKGCQSEEQSCLSAAKQVCTSPMPDPTSGITPMKVCQIDPDEQAKCERQRATCESSCSQIQSGPTQ